MENQISKAHRSSGLLPHSLWAFLHIYSAGNGKTKRIANTGGHDRVTMFDHHDAIIIPKEMFDRVQDERSARSNVEIGEDGQPHRKSMRYTASKKEIPQSE